MNKAFVSAFNELKAIGAPVRKEEDSFIISGEENYNEIWADYWEEFTPTDWEGINPKITKILEKYNLECGWENAGILSVYER
ncbi:MAG: hypothetical protein ACO20M_05270 [Methylophilaceae bacterium]